MLDLGASPDLLAKLLSSGLLVTLVGALAFCVCCKKKHADVTDSYECSAKSPPSVDGLYAVADFENDSHPAGRQAHNGSLSNVRALPAVPCGAVPKRPATSTAIDADLAYPSRSSVTRESSTSDLYATVEKPPPVVEKAIAPDDRKCSHQYYTIEDDSRACSRVVAPMPAEIIHVHDDEESEIDPLYSRVKERDEDEPFYTKIGVAGGAVEPPYSVVRSAAAGSESDPLYSRVCDLLDVDDELYAQAKGGADSDDETSDPKYAKVKQPASNLYARINKENGGEGSSTVRSPRPLSDVSAGARAPAVPAKRLSAAISYDGVVAGGATDQNQDADAVPPVGGDGAFVDDQANTIAAEPPYKYITVRESLETLRARIDATERAQRSGAANRQETDPQHYYSSISEYGYETLDTRRDPPAPPLLAEAAVQSERVEHYESIVDQNQNVFPTAGSSVVHSPSRFPLRVLVDENGARHSPSHSPAARPAAASKSGEYDNVNDGAGERRVPAPRGSSSSRDEGAGGSSSKSGQNGAPTAVGHNRQGEEASSAVRDKHYSSMERPVSIFRPSVGGGADEEVTIFAEFNGRVTAGDAGVARQSCPFAREQLNVNGVLGSTRRANTEELATSFCFCHGLRVEPAGAKK